MHLCWPYLIYLVFSYLSNLLQHLKFFAKLLFKERGKTNGHHSWFYFKWPTFKIQKQRLAKKKNTASGKVVPNVAWMSNSARTSSSSSSQPPFFFLRHHNYCLRHLAGVLYGRFYMITAYCLPVIALRRTYLDCCEIIPHTCNPENTNTHTHTLFALSNLPTPPIISNTNTRGTCRCEDSLCVLGNH